MPIEVEQIHRELVAIPSVSGSEAAIADFVCNRLEGLGTIDRIGDNVAVRKGSGPLVLLCSHLDTVPPNQGWTREPWKVEVDEDRVYGLGSNDAKASVAAMIDAFTHFPEDAGVSVALLLAAFEETGGDGVELAWPALRDRGWEPAGVVVGEPTGLDVAVAQKGMLFLELFAHGDACHSANAKALGAKNPIAALARDLVALESLDLGPVDPHLGETTLQPTVLTAGKARNQVPATAYAHLDLRTVPSTPHADLVERVRAVVDAEVKIRSDRLIPTSCPEGAAILDAALSARPASKAYGSPTMSDMVFFDGLPVVKCGPGQSARSHRPDEFVLRSELREGAAFYRSVLQGMTTRVG